MKEKSLLQKLAKPKEYPKTLDELEDTALQSFDKVLALENKRVPGFGLRTMQCVGRKVPFALWHPRHELLPIITLADLRKFEGHLVLQAVMPESEDSHEVDIYIFSATGMKRGIRHAYSGPLHEEVFDTGTTMRLQQSFFEMELQDPPLEEDFRVVAAALSHIPKHAPRRQLR
jgi:hypothetical protein